MKRNLSIVAVIAIVALLAYPKVSPYLFNDTSSSETNSAGSEEIQPVEVFVAGEQSVDNVIFTTGTLSANETVELSSETSGIIDQIYLKEGQPVKKGMLLIKINDSELQAQLQRAQFRLSLAEERERRQRQLLEKGGISQEEYDATLNEVNVLRSELALIKAQIDKTEISAPFSGVLGLKYISDGSYITPATRIATLQDLDPIKLNFSVPEKYASSIQVGRELEFTVEGREGSIRGKVYAKEPNINTETRTLDVRALSSNSRGDLLPGAFAEIRLILNTVEQAVMIPSIALVPELQGQKVFLLKNGKVQPSSVQTGIRNERLIQITSGVASGDTVLTTGLLQVRPGMSVRVTNIRGGA